MVTQTNPEENSGSVTPGSEEEVSQYPGSVSDGSEEGQQQATERLYAGRYKTPDELEAGYKESQREATRMAQELKRMQQVLQSVQSKPGTSPKTEDIPDFVKAFEPETAKNLQAMIRYEAKKLVEDSLSRYSSAQTQAQQVSKLIESDWSKLCTEHPDLKNTSSKLYQTADRLLFALGLAQRDANGELSLAHPFAYRLAVNAALTELNQTSASAAGVNQPKKNLAGKVAGTGSPRTTGKKLTKEEYLRLSDEDKDAYDLASMSGGVR